MLSLCQVTRLHRNLHHDLSLDTSEVLSHVQIAIETYESNLIIASPAKTQLNAPPALRDVKHNLGEDQMISGRGKTSNNKLKCLCNNYKQLKSKRFKQD